MKKIFLVSLFFVAISCSYRNQEVKFVIATNSEQSNLGNGAALDITVFDDRLDKEIVGKKTFGEEDTQITNDQNLAEILKEKIGASLWQKGFKQGKDKIVEIRLQKLIYASSRGFPVGHSEAHGLVKVVVKNKKTRSEFTKNYILDMNSKHFIVSCKSTDKKTINSLLQELVDDVVSDKTLLQNLAQ